MLQLASADPRHPSGTRIWTVERFYTTAECEGAIADAERRGFEEALITTGRGMVMRKDVRNNDRVIFDDPTLASALFGKVEPHVPRTLRDLVFPEEPPWALTGLNERFRVYRYHPGHRFKPHFDGAFVRERDVEESALTFMIYLNDDFDGGATEFLDDDVTIVPRAGSALFFFHPLLHEGCEVTRGTKYVLRTDVMYRRS